MNDSSYPDSLKRMTPFSSSICQEVSSGSQSVLSSSSNLNSPTPQEQSGVIVGAEEEVGIEDGREEVDGTKDGGVEGSIDGVEDGEMEGREEAVGFMDGGEEEVGINVIDGTADGTPRLGSHGISIFHGSKYASHKA